MYDPRSSGCTGDMFMNGTTKFLTAGSVGHGSMAYTVLCESSRSGLSSWVTPFAPLMSSENG